MNKKGDAVIPFLMVAAAIVYSIWPITNSYKFSKVRLLWQ